MNRLITSREWGILHRLLADTPEAESPDFPSNAAKLGHAIGRYFLRTPSLQFPRHILQVGGCGEYLTEINISLPYATTYLINGEDPLPFIRQLGPRDVIPRDHFDLILLPANHLLRNSDSLELEVLLAALKPRGKLIMPILLNDEQRISVGSEVFFVKDIGNKELQFGRYSFDDSRMYPTAQVKPYGLSDTDLEFPGTVAEGQLMVFSK